MLKKIISLEVASNLKKKSVAYIKNER